MLSPNILNKKKKKEIINVFSLPCTIHNSIYNLSPLLFTECYKKKCNKLLHELDMSKKAGNNIKLDSIPYFYL